MSTDAFTERSLGEIESAGSRHMWTRSSVLLTDGLVVVGQWDGTLTAVDPESLAVQWSNSHPDRAVGLETVGNLLVVAGRGASGTVGTYDLESGERLWRYETSSDVGEPDRESVFYLPYVVALETVGSDEKSRPTPETSDEDEAENRRTIYAAARRYERDGERHQWYSTVYAFDPDGSVRWHYETDASPIALDLDASGSRLAVGYNRCMGEHDNGLVVLDAETGAPCWTWDPGTDGDRRVGDVSVDGDRIAVSSHGDKRGYVLGDGGRERWRVDLAVETTIGDERLYAYPNHVYANDGRVAFVTGNTYSLEGRETESHHPNEHRITAFDARGELLWDADVGGFVHGLATGGDTIVAPCAQNFRSRDADTHAVWWYDLEFGERGCESIAGIATAASIENDTVAAIEEPVEYHDEDRTRGKYAVHVGSLEDRIASSVSYSK